MKVRLQLKNPIHKHGTLLVLNIVLVKIKKAAKSCEVYKFSFTATNWEKNFPYKIVLNEFHKDLLI